MACTLVVMFSPTEAISSQMQIKWNLQNDSAFHEGNLCQYKIRPIKIWSVCEVSFIVLSDNRTVKVEKIAFSSNYSDK